MLTRPSCLHIPPLYEEGAARILWESVEGAGGYELDLHYDEDFSAGSTGRTWSDIDMSRVSWAEADALQRTWDQLESLPAQGLSWGNIGFRAPSWDEIDAGNLTWEELQKLPVEFTVFKGEGEKAQAPDQGLSWQNIALSGLTWDGMASLGWTWEDFMFRPSLGLSWAQIEGEGKTWAGIHNAGMTWREMEYQPARGLCWGSLDGKFLTWDEIGAQDMTWHQRDNQPADAKTHIAHTVSIPLYKKKAAFRVRAYNAAESSPYLESTLAPVIPVFYRDDATRLDVTEGETCRVQLHAKGIHDFAGIVMQLRYPARLLAVEEVLADSAVAVEQSDGRILFCCTKPVPPGREWSGGVMLVRFKALQSGTADITLS
jgi:hypothetical protein